LHYHRNLLTRVPKSAQPWVSTLVRTIFEQPGTDSVRAQHAQVVAALEARFPAAAAHLDDAREDILAFTAFPREVWRQIWGNNPQERLNKEVRRRTDVVGHLPRPRRHHPPGRRGAGRAERRMDRVAPLHGPGNPRRLPESRPARYGKE
jgi:transposase-like protein